ncbi:helix-turn-helix domain-containing protein [Mucilaginibacter ginsenosidivorax]|uniref:Helix-turn-helix domain-containing protein n=2 Tax=Mucilaginibacter ginsenosidivorax TaxID=862126 RepID=A0A5B8W9K9_9SPHI|nr:helix-turn-helix domain-containing protein [Mucilaginibacter ginsenosidivorax]
MASEYLVPEHALTYVISGEFGINKFGKKYTYGAGESVLFKRNELARFTKDPLGETPFSCVTIFFMQPFLQKYYTTNAPAQAFLKEEHESYLKMIPFCTDPLFESLFNSVLPYYKYSNPLPQELISMKLMEAMTILRTINKKGTDSILSDFAEPGKIDLGDFMEKNFTYNVNLERFGYLTGRSLATFKRDFQKTFNTTPQKWLLQKRLEQAHFLLTTNKKKPSEVYLEVGFENLSHFSASFKQMFGYNASSL